jgi:hypothetical protein
MSEIRFNADLIYDFAMRKVAIFVGSGVSASAIPRDGKRIRTWGEFLSDIAKSHLPTNVVTVVEELIQKSDYLLACEITKNAIGNEEWSRIINSEYSKAADISDLQSEILKIDQRILVTTNFDRLLEENRGGLFPQEERYPTVLKGIDSQIFKIFRDSNVYIIKMHGSIEDESSLIFTKSDYIKRAYGSSLYRAFFENLIINYTLLFVGFSMDDPVISMIVDDCAFKYPSLRPHHIFMPGEIPEQIKSSYRDLKKLHIHEYSPENNHEELPRMLMSLRMQVEKNRREIIAETKLNSEPIKE